MLTSVKRDIITDPNGVPLHGSSLDHLDEIIVNEFRLPKAGSETAIGDIRGGGVQIGVGGVTDRVGRVGALRMDSNNYVIEDSETNYIGAVHEDSSYPGSAEILLRRGVTQKVRLRAGEGAASFIDLDSIIIGGTSTGVPVATWPFQVIKKAYFHNNVDIVGNVTCDVISAQQVTDLSIAKTMASLNNEVGVNTAHANASGMDHSQVSENKSDIDIIKELTTTETLLPVTSDDGNDTWVPTSLSCTYKVYHGLISLQLKVQGKFTNGGAHSPQRVSVDLGNIVPAGYNLIRFDGVCGSFDDISGGKKYAVATTQGGNVLNFWPHSGGSTFPNTVCKWAVSGTFTLQPV